MGEVSLWIAREGGGKWKAKADDRTSSKKGNGNKKGACLSPATSKQQRARNSSRERANSNLQWRRKVRKAWVRVESARNRVNPVRLACLDRLYYGIRSTTVRT